MSGPEIQSATPEPSKETTKEAALERLGIELSNLRREFDSLLYDKTIGFKDRFEQLRVVEDKAYAFKDRAIDELNKAGFVDDNSRGLLKTEELDSFTSEITNRVSLMRLQLKSGDWLIAAPPKDPSLRRDFTSPDYDRYGKKPKTRTEKLDVQDRPFLGIKDIDHLPTDSKLFLQRHTDLLRALGEKFSRVFFVEIKCADSATFELDPSGKKLEATMTVRGIPVANSRRRVEITLRASAYYKDYSNDFGRTEDSIARGLRQALRADNFD